MHYYEVLVSSQRYHSDKPLTYCHASTLAVGTTVIVPMQKQTVVAVVVREVSRPSFQTKEITRIVNNVTLPRQILDLIGWLKAYYPAPLGQIVSLALPGSLTATSRNTSADHGKATSPVKLPPLNPEQARAIKTIEQRSPHNVILHGDTGTGKTRIYMELARKSLDAKKSVIILTPEIGLTPQATQAFEETFPGQVVTTHSELTPATRRNMWLRIIQADTPLVVIGPRSALFSPIRNLGLVVVDEFHESSYKQEQAPHYLATRVAAKLAELHKAQLILGSATPPVSDYFAFKEKKLPIVRLKEQAVKNNFGEPVIHVIDLKDKQKFSRSAWISDDLIASMKESLKNGQQSLVFLNRRGTARLTLCQACGWQAFCPNCDLPLTYHQDIHKMRCHTCGHAEKTPASCPECGAYDISFRSVGTKSIVSEIERLVPNATVRRFDSDVSKSDSLTSQYTSVKEGSVDIIVGTQMLGKGLDLPKLSVVGIITAETSLAFPDYTAEERTYQLITQALGRVNRGHLPGTAIVQTYHPNSQTLAAAIKRDYDSFYESQIDERKLYRFPPFRFVLKLTCTRATAAAAQRTSLQLTENLKNRGLAIELSGPNPAFTEKTHGKYRWQLIVKAVKRQILVDIVHDLPANWSYDIDPINLL